MLILETMMGPSWEEVVISGTWQIKYVKNKISLNNLLTCERREEEGMAGRVATPPVVSAEVTRLCRLETETSWTNNYLRRREKVTCCQ